MRTVGSIERSVFEYKSFEANPKLDSELFTLKGVEIPAGTRFLDRRPDAPSRIHDYDGSGLSPRRSP